MNEDKILLDKIGNYLSKSNIEKSENIISFYDLCNILENKLQDIINLTVNSKLDREFERSNKKRLIPKNNIPYLAYFTNEIVRSSIVINIPKENIMILYKNKNDDSIYFNCNSYFNNNLLKEHYNTIVETFSIIEKYTELFSEIRNRKNYYKSKDELFNVTLVYDDCGLITRIDSKEFDDLIKRDWYKGKALYKMINDIKEEVFKRIPVDVSKLNGFLKTSVEESLSKQKSKTKK